MRFEWEPTYTEDEREEEMMKVANKIDRLIDAGAVVVWKPIAGFEGYYEVNNLGDVRSIARIDSKGRPVGNRILNPGKNRGGYLVVGLYKNGQRKNCLVHRLVAGAFIEECPEGFQVNHRNEIKTDNRLENLEYVTPKQNMNHGTGLARMTRAKGISVESYDLKTGKTIKRYQSARAAERNGYDQGNICRCINGHQKFHAGLGWRRSTTR